MRARQLDEVLKPVERLQVRLVRATLGRGGIDRAVRFLQRNVGAPWINAATAHLRHVTGLERALPLDPRLSYVIAGNHRTFFDLFVVTCHMLANGLRHRVLFPVRSRFFYDNPLGLLLNASMSYLAMYPPVFRERERAAANLASVEEMIRLLRVPGTLMGLHPEGTRNHGDAYTLLPARTGIGRVVHASGAQVLPVFINGLSNRLGAQLWGNLTGRGPPVILVFGAPVPMDDLRPLPAAKAHRAITARIMESIAALGEEERALRVALVGGGAR